MIIESLIIAAVMLAGFQKPQDPYDNIVRIIYSESRMAMGSVIEVDNKKVLLTNKHVCDDILQSNTGGYFNLYTNKGDSFSASLDMSKMDNNQSLDACIIHGDFDKFKALKIGYQDKKTKILTYDSISSLEHFTSKKQFDDVLISEYQDTDILPIDLSFNMQIDSKILKGMSGTPVLNSKSEVIGIVWGNNPVHEYFSFFNYSDFNSPNNVRNGYIIIGKGFNSEIQRMVER